MGQPVFEVEDIIKEHDIQVFSSNYTLYATLSDRVMRVLSQFSPTLEVYSIDEAFADLTDLPIYDLTEYGKTMKAQVLQYTGLPVSVGIAATKCLCKIANEIVKHDPSYEGVLDPHCIARGGGGYTPVKGCHCRCVGYWQQICHLFAKPRDYECQRLEICR